MLTFINWRGRGRHLKFAVRYDCMPAPLAGWHRSWLVYSSSRYVMCSVSRCAIHMLFYGKKSMFLEAVN